MNICLVLFASVRYNVVQALFLVRDIIFEWGDDR